jgi:RND family efflux transporter MFP subunit
MIRDKIKRYDKKIIYSALVTAVVVVSGIGSITFGKSRHESNAPATETPFSVTAVAVETRTVDSVVSAAGTLSSRNTSILSSKVMVKVVALTINEGDYVTTGKLLARIESGEIAAQTYQAQAAYHNAKLHFDRIKRLFDEKASTQMEMDQATRGLESAKAGLNAAKAMESYTMITAPISGQIMEKRINLGEMALPGQPILKIEDNRKLRLDATLQEHDIRSVRPGQTVAVRMDSLPDAEIRGTVAQVVPAADIRTHSFTVKIDIPADKRLITGMYGKALFSIGRRETILIPRSAVVEMAGLTGVYLVSGDGNAVFQMVQLGESRGDNVEAVTGLKTGDRVIVSTHDGRIDGRKVIVARQ